MERNWWAVSSSEGCFIVHSMNRPPEDVGMDFRGEDGEIEWSFEVGEFAVSLEPMTEEEANEWLESVETIGR